MNLDKKQQIELHLSYIKMFGLKVGDIIEVSGWFDYVVKGDGFYTLINGEEGKKKNTYAYQILMERKFKKRA